ncbi:MAG TPA: cytochrome P450 [Streptosporangiaceae bacterium]|jgi:cytochrome P450|nr:cytochrome P450 [Streptosporangiaceae bacterium]
MTDAPPVPPYLSRRGEFDPDPGTTRPHDQAAIRRVPAPFGGEAWLVTRSRDVREVLADPGRFSSALPRDLMGGVGAGQSIAGDLLFVDPPEHTRLRRMLTPEFTVRRIDRLRPRIEAIVEEHLDAMARTGPPADLVRAFALPVPALTICELLGVPYEDRADFQRRVDGLTDLAAPPDKRTAVLAESRAYMAGLVARARAEPDTTGILGALCRAHGNELSTDELAGIGTLLLLAGYESAANTLALGTLALLRHPDQLRIVRDRPEHLDTAVDELLRYLSVVQAGFRVTTERVELAGQVIGAGELVIVSLSAAGRDPGLLADPDALDVTRPVSAHLAFGHGVHHCLGAPLARAELRIAYPALLRRFPGLRLADPLASVPLRAHNVIHGVTSLPVMW